MRVLIVDDSAVMRKMICLSMEQMAPEVYQFVEAADGVEALQMLSQHSFDLVLTDWNMPNMNGLAFVQQARKHPAFKKMPIIMITTEAEKTSVVAALQSGVNNYIIKPFDAPTLAAKIDVTMLKARK